MPTKTKVKAVQKRAEPKTKLRAAHKLAEPTTKPLPLEPPPPAPEPKDVTPKTISSEELSEQLGATPSGVQELAGLMEKIRTAPNETEADKARRKMEAIVNAASLKGSQDRQLQEDQVALNG